MSHRSPPLTPLAWATVWLLAMASAAGGCNILTGAQDLHIRASDAGAIGAAGGSGGLGSGGHAGGTGPAGGSGQAGSGTGNTGGPAGGTGGSIVTGGSGGIGGDPSTGGGAGCVGTGGAVGACTVALASRAVVTPVDVSASVGGAVWLAPQPSGCSKAAWTGGGQVHVTPLTVTGTRFAPDATASGSELRGMVAHDDGSALLVRQDDRMVLLRLAANGSTAFQKSIVGGNSHSAEGDKWIDSWPHQGRLAWSGSTYATYFGHTQNFGANGNHQGDILAYYDAAGGPAGAGWSWGCSHSLDVRLAHNGTTFGPVCLSDCYPDKGIYYDHYDLISAEPSGDCLGGSSASLGGLTPEPSSGFWFTYSSEEGRPSFDIALVHIANNGTVGAPMWITDTPNVDEKNTTLARYGPDLLVAWQQGASVMAAIVTTAGVVTDGPVALSGVSLGGGDFINHDNGDVGWASGAGASLQIVRLPYCQ